MNKETQKGWLMALSYKDNTNWGSVKEFFDNIDPSKAGNIINVESEVRGKFDKKGIRPGRGDGWAFYHTRKARFERPDPYGRRSRISLIGELMDFQ